jgi:hypothetical protein
MANKEEKLKLLPSKGQRVQAPSGERRVIVDGLSELMRARYADAFGDAVPQSLQPGAKSLLTTAMENRDRELAKKGMPCISLEGMQAWRAAFHPLLANPINRKSGVWVRKVTGQPGCSLHICMAYVWRVGCLVCRVFLRFFGNFFAGKSHF